MGGLWVLLLWLTVVPVQVWMEGVHRKRAGGSAGLVDVLQLEGCSPRSSRGPEGLHVGHHGVLKDPADLRPRGGLQLRGQQDPAEQHMFEEKVEAAPDRTGQKLVPNQVSCLSMRKRMVVVMKMMRRKKMMMVVVMVMW